MCFCSTLCGIYRDDFLYNCYIKIEDGACKTKIDTKWLVGFYSFAGLIVSWLLALLMYFVWMDGKRRGGAQSMPMSTQIEMEEDDENTRGGTDMRGDFELVSSVSSHGGAGARAESSSTDMQDVSLHEDNGSDDNNKLPPASDDSDQHEVVTSALHSEQV